MAHFAQLNDENVVTQVIVVANAELIDNGVESETKGIAFCESLLGGRWVQTSYSGSIRKRFAGIGYRYEADADVFVSQRPFPSWSLDANHDWQAPTPMPTDEKQYSWDEPTLAWVEIEGKN
jgi:hypothetical protein